MSESNNTTYVNNFVTFPSRLITPSLSSVLIAFCRFFIGIIQDGVVLGFSLILVTKANVVERGTTSDA